LHFAESTLIKKTGTRLKKLKRFEIENKPFDKNFTVSLLKNLVGIIGESHGKKG